MLRRILYTSRAADGIGMRDCYDVIRVSHNRNSRVGITGGLMFLDGYFYQLIEGLPPAIEARMSRIGKDPRHTDLLIRKDEIVSRPVFESEWMALRDGSTIDPSILRSYHYQIGCPAASFDSDRLFDFMIDCFDQQTAAVS